jgi:hypothetical protein
MAKLIRLTSIKNNIKLNPMTALLSLILQERLDLLKVQ